MFVYNLGVLRQYAAAVSAAMSVFIVGMWLSWPSSAVKNILAGKTTLTIDSDKVSWAVALLDLGNVLSPIPSSYISDWLGRKKTLISLSFALFASWLLVIFGTNEYYLYVARTIVGLSKGFAFTVVPIYLGEIANTNVRGGVGTIFCAMMNCGILFELCMGPLFTYDMLNIFSSPFPILFFLCFFRFPESPYFLLMKGRVDEALKSLAWFRNFNEQSPALQQELNQISSYVEEDMKQEGSFKDLMSTPSARKAMLISMGFALLQRLGGVTSIISYSSITLPPNGGYFSAEIYMVIFGVTMIIGPFLCGVLIDRVGRKPLMVLSSAGCGLCTGVSALFYWLSVSNDLSHFNWVPYCCVVVYGIMFSIGLGTIPSIIVVELFPSDIRSYATSVAAIFYSIGSFITNKLYLYVTMTLGVQYMYIFFTISLILCTILTCTMLFETNGKSFLEIQNILKNKKDDPEGTLKQKV